MPALSFAEIAGEAEPPVARAATISSNALRQRRFRERHKKLRDTASKTDATDVTPFARVTPDEHYGNADDTQDDADDETDGTRADTGNSPLAPDFDRGNHWVATAELGADGQSVARHHRQHIGRRRRRL